MLRISPNHGQAWPLAIKGWPIIKAKWDSPNSISLHYSKDSEIFLQDENVNGMDIRFFPITKEFIETENLEIR